MTLTLRLGVRERRRQRSREPVPTCAYATHGFLVQAPAKRAAMAAQGACFLGAW